MGYASSTDLERSSLHLVRRLSLVTIVGLMAAGCGPEPPVFDGEVISQFTRHLPALDEDVVFVLAQASGSATHKFVVRADGRHQAPGAVRREEEAMHELRFGSMDVDLWRRASEADADDRMPVALYLHQPPELEGLLDELRGAPEPTRRLVRQQLVAAIAERAAPVLEELEMIKAERVAAARSMPAVFAEVTPAQADELSRHPAVALMTRGGSSEGVEMAPPITPGNSLTVPHVDTVLNPTWHGAGQKIGLVEDARCRLFSEHQTFDDTTIIEEPGSILECQTDSCCASHCEGDSKCVRNAANELQCVDDHVSRIASQVAQSLFLGEYGATQAEIYHPTQGDGTAITCSSQGIANAYDWLADHGVTTTSESWGCPGGHDGMAQDWYARYHDMAVFRAAGNSSDVDALPGCRPINSICVGGMQPDGAGGWQMWPDSSWMNPATPNSDREEPDIVALARNVDLIEVAATASPDFDPITNVWDDSRDGTSYAAPAMATIAVLLKEACGGSIDEKYLRALLMTSAWSINPHGSAYSTPASQTDCGPTPDCRDGAGSPTAENALLFCGHGENPIDVGGGTVDVDLQGGSPAPEWMDGAAAGGFVILGPNPNTPFNVTKLRSWLLEPGDRIRVTFTWNGCPGSNIGTGPAPLPADMDLWLCREAIQTCVKVSRSFDNNIEGFDYTVPPPPSGATAWHDLYYGYDPDNSPGCPYPWVKEPAGWAYAVGPSAFFAASTTSIEPTNNIEFHIFGDVAEATLTLDPDGTPVATVTAGTEGGQAGIMFVIPTAELDELLCPGGCTIMTDGVALETTKKTGSVAYWATTALEPDEVVVIALKAGKVTLCHAPPGNPANAHTISVGAAAVGAHLAHGDALGPCPGDSE